MLLIAFCTGIERLLTTIRFIRLSVMRKVRLLRGFISFDGSYLDFEEYIEIHLDRIIKHRYKYQYIKEGEEVFRYDNFPLHPGVPFPYHHHKHVRDVERVEILADAPRLIQVISEVVDMLFV